MLAKCKFLVHSNHNQQFTFKKKLYSWAVPAPHQLQQSEEWAPRLDWATQYSWPWRCRFGKTHLEDMEARELTLPAVCSFPHDWREWTSKGNVGELTLVMRMRRAGRLISSANPQAQNQAVLAYPIIHPTCDLLEYREGDRVCICHMDPGLQDLQDIG